MTHIKRRNDYDDTLNMPSYATDSRLFAAILFSFLTVVGLGSNAVGSLLVAPIRTTGEIVEHSSQGAARRAAQREAGMGKHGGRQQLPDQPLRPGSQSPTGERGVRTEVRSTDTGDVVHHDPHGTRYEDGTVTPPHYGVNRPGTSTVHHTYPSNYDPRTNR